MVMGSRLLKNGNKFETICMADGDVKLIEKNCNKLEIKGLNDGDETAD